MAMHLIGMYVVGVKEDLTGVEYCGEVKNLDLSGSPYIQTEECLFIELATLDGIPLNVYAFKTLTARQLFFKTRQEMVDWIHSSKKTE